MRLQSIYIFIISLNFFNFETILKPLLDFYFLILLCHNWFLILIFYVSFGLRFSNKPLFQLPPYSNYRIPSGFKFKKANLKNFLYHRIFTVPFFEFPTFILICFLRLLSLQWAYLSPFQAICKFKWALIYLIDFFELFFPIIS